MSEVEDEVANPVGLNVHLIQKCVVITIIIYRQNKLMVVKNLGEILIK